MLSIGEFARHGGVSVRMLRHYDTLGLLVPARVDRATGYRSYAASQLSRLNRLVALKELGFSLDELAPVLDARVSAEELRGMLRLRRAQVADQLAASAIRLRAVEARLRLVEREGTMSELEFVEKRMPALRLAQVVERVSDRGEIGQRMGPMFDRLSADLTAAGLPLRDPAVAWYDEDGGDLVMAAGFGCTEPTVDLEGIEIAELPAYDRAVSVVHNGSMETIDATWQALHEHIEAHGTQPAGPCREVYLETPVDDPEAWVTELQQPVVPSR